MKSIFSGLLIVFSLSTVALAQVNYTSQIQPILNAQCVGCHGPGQGIDLRNYNAVMNSISNQYSSNLVIASNADASPLYDKVRIDQQPKFGSRMPQGGQLSQDQIDLIKNWIQEGAQENATTSNEEINHSMNFALLGNYPNPFNPSTQIRFSSPSQVPYSISVYNVVGQRVITMEGLSTAGLNTVQLSMNNQTSGLYIYELTLGNNLNSIRRFTSTFTLLK